MPQCEQKAAAPPGLEGVDRQRGLAAAIRNLPADRQVKGIPFLVQNRAVALRQQIQIDTRPKRTRQPNGKAALPSSIINTPSAT